ITEKSMTFNDLGLESALLRAVEEKGYTTPSAIQEQGIPVILKGGDLMAAAQTGTGKTAGFTLPMLQLLNNRPKAKTSPNPRVLVLTPTRELAAQVHESVLTYGKYLKLTSTVVFGGVSINPQIKILRKGVDILVATPGRLLDLHQQRIVRLDEVEIFVLDEADRMLDMGFIRDIRRILPLLPKQRQNLLFSATFSDEIRQLARGFIHNPAEISVTPRNTAAESVAQTIIPVDKGNKPALLCHLIKEKSLYQALVFSRTKHGANKLVEFLGKNAIAAGAIHGNKSQNHRTKVLAEFKAGKLQILVATDIAARGIDISQLPHVINFDLPQVPEDYVHRIGRTGRAGAEGEAFSLVCDEEVDMLRAIERLIGKAIPRTEIPGFELSKPLPQYAPKTPGSNNSRNRSGNRSRSSGNPGSSQQKRNPGNTSNSNRRFRGRGASES
ncbi:MAG: DEAD/DEAH box helicase, partial [Porticoccaceae bacterium]